MPSKMRTDCNVKNTTGSIEGRPISAEVSCASARTTPRPSEYSKSRKTDLGDRVLQRHRGQRPERPLLDAHHGRPLLPRGRSADGATSSHPAGPVSTGWAVCETRFVMTSEAGVGKTVGRSHLPPAAASPSWLTRLRIAKGAPGDLETGHLAAQRAFGHPGLPRPRPCRLPEEDDRAEEFAGA